MLCVRVVRMISQIYHCKKNNWSSNANVRTFCTVQYQDKSLKNSIELNTQFTLLLNTCFKTLEICFNVCSRSMNLFKVSDCKIALTDLSKPNRSTPLSTHE